MFILALQVCRGIPRDVEDITDYLEGKQIDISGSINIDAGLFAGVGKGLNVNLDENGWPFYTPEPGICILRNRTLCWAVTDFLTYSILTVKSARVSRL